MRARHQIINFIIKIVWRAFDVWILNFTAKFPSLDKYGEYCDCENPEREFNNLFDKELSKIAQQT